MNEFNTCILSVKTMCKTSRIADIEKDDKALYDQNKNQKLLDNQEVVIITGPFFFIQL